MCRVSQGGWSLTVLGAAAWVTICDQPNIAATPGLTSGRRSGAMAIMLGRESRVLCAACVHFRAPPPEVANFSEKPFAIVIST